MIFPDERLRPTQHDPNPTHADTVPTPSRPTTLPPGDAGPPLSPRRYVDLPNRDELVPVRVALATLAGKLRALSDEACGVLRGEAREVWLYSVLPLGRTEDFVHLVHLVTGVCQWVDNWADQVQPAGNRGGAARAEARALGVARSYVQEAPCATLDEGLANQAVGKWLEKRIATLPGPTKSELEDDAFYDGFVLPARDAADTALDALLLVVDAMRERAPECMR